jgi:hypothetical protein
LPFDTEVKDESLAMKIFLQNLTLVQEIFLASNNPSQTKQAGEITEYVKNEKDLLDIIMVNPIVRTGNRSNETISYRFY